MLASLHGCLPSEASRSTFTPPPPPPLRLRTPYTRSCPPAPSHTHRSEDDLTHQLGEIIKANNRLRKQEESGAPQHIIAEFALLLQMHISGYIDNSLPGLPQAKQRSGRPIKSICQRLKGAPPLPGSSRAASGRLLRVIYA